MIDRYIPRSWGPALLVAAVGIMALLPAILLGIPDGPDIFNHYRFAVPFYDAILAGDLYPSWLALSNLGYGDPSFRFYPPGLYYLLAAFRLLTGDWHTASLWTFTLLSVVGGLGAYFWASAFVPRHLAMWAGVLYAFAPYRVNEIYEASLLAEYAGGAVLPFAFAFVERVCRTNRRRDTAGLAAAYALLLLTHLPLTVVGSLSLGVYGLLCLEKGKACAALLRLVAAVALGLVASSPYWMRMIPELSWIWSNNILHNDWYDYRHHFLFIDFDSKHVGIWWANLLGLASIAMCLPALALIYRLPFEEKPARGARAAGLVTLLSLLMATPVSRPVWAVMPMLHEVQFPWRWLAVTSATGAIALAASLPLWKEAVRGPKRPLALIAFGGVIMAIALTLSSTMRAANYFAPTEFNSRLQSIPGSPSIPYWLPIWTTEPPEAMVNPLDIGGRAYRVASWKAERRIFDVAAGPATDARVRTFFYPHWTATANGQSLPVRPEKDGAILISLPAEAVSVTLEFIEPTQVRVATIMGITGWISIFLLFAFGSRKPKSHARFI
ncbi:MAG: hypothetical protein H0T92_16310 [Pyrinomonadaceae bacterium]|nr:hypothetical protein [Pyrinomonadaceae bacterium]